MNQLQKIDIHVEAVKKNGYTIIKSALNDELTKALLEKILSLEKKLPAVSAETIPYLNRGHRVVYSLENKDIIFVKSMLNHPIAKGIKMKLLNDTWYKQIPAENPNYILRAMLARSGGPEPLPLHIDSFIPSSGSYSWAVQTAFILENQTIENGCMIVVPGSHLYDRYATQKERSGAIALELEKGDIAIWDSRLWHGTEGNKTTQTRWAFIGTFTRWWVKQNYQTTKNIPISIYNALTDEEKAILGFCSSPPFNEYERIDIKGGYELLKKHQEHLIK